MVFLDTALRMSLLVFLQVFKVVSVGIWDESIVVLYASKDVILEDGG